jgi:hypothetical protein
MRALSVGRLKPDKLAPTGTHNLGQSPAVDLRPTAEHPDTLLAERIRNS